MSDEEARAFWERARAALEAAKRNLAIDTATAANRAYYAAFYAVSGLFALEGKTSKKHSGVESLVHRDLVKPGRWPTDLGSDYRFLGRLRVEGDYDMTASVTPEGSRSAVEKACRILEAVRQERPDVFGNMPLNPK